MLDHIADLLKALGIAAPGRLGWVTVILTFVIAVLAAWSLTPRVRVFCLRVGWADEPSPRRLNQEPLPNAGGLAIYAAVILALVIATLLRPILISEVQIQLLAMLLGGSFLLITGFIDDQYGLPPALKLAVQVVAALLLVSVGIRIGFADSGSGATAVSILVTFAWLIGITNAINLVDGVDGLAGGVGFITGMSLLAVSAQNKATAAATLVLAALAGAALGFLRHNFPPSRIIMGDSGAYFLGFVLAATSILGQVKITTVFALVPTVLFLFLPLLDTVQVFLRRLFKRKNPLSSPGTDHLHHRLLASGLSQLRTTLILWAVTMVANIVAMAIQGMSALQIGMTTVVIVALLGFTVWRRRHALERGTPAAKAGAAPAAAEGSAAPATGLGGDAGSAAVGSPAHIADADDTASVAGPGALAGTAGAVSGPSGRSEDSPPQPPER